MFRGLSATFFLLILILLLPAANDDLLLFVSSALGVLAQLLLLDGDGHWDYGLGVEQAKCLRCLVILPPGLSNLWRVIDSPSTLVLHCISMLLGLDFLNLLVLGFINLLWSLLPYLGHLLSHDLSEGVAPACGRVEPFLGLRLVFFFL